MAAVKESRKKQAEGARVRPPRSKSGEAMTGKVTDALAREAERGYDLTRARSQRVGRPSLGRGGTSPRVTFRAPSKLYRAAQAQAKREGRSISELARDALAEYIAA